MKTLMTLPALVLLGCGAGATGTGGGKNTSRTPEPTPTPSITEHIPRVTPQRGSRTQNAFPTDARILLLHTATGATIHGQGGVSEWIALWNREHQTQYVSTARTYPASPYGQSNMPHDYWKIWVENAGTLKYLGQESLELMAPDHQLLSWKHDSKVNDLEADSGQPAPEQSRRALENYKLQYEALKSKMHEFPATRFLVWTGTPRADEESTAEEGARLKAFRDWAIDTWDETGDNIFVFDFWTLATAGALSLKPEHARYPGLSEIHPGFAMCVAPLYVQRVVDVLEGYGDTSPLTGGPLADDPVCRRALD